MRQNHSADFYFPGWRRLPAIMLAVLLTAVTPIAAEPPSSILEEVRTMLEAEISEPIIVKWLAGSDRKPRRPSAAELIGLKQAGASDELLARLLELAGEAPDDGVVEPPAEAPAAVTPPAAPTAPPPSAVPPQPAAPTQSAATGEIPVHFELSYVPDFDEDEDEWGLYVYVDGEPLTYVPAGSLLGARPLRFRQFFAPGSHSLRVTQERHVKRGRDRWFHAARMAGLELPLELMAGAGADVELKFRQSQLAFGGSDGPLSFRLVQGKKVEVIEKQGGDPESWPLVCEEIEANAGAGKELKKSLRRQLDDCTPWSELWDGLEVPGRDQVREALALFRYRPIPKDQPLD